VHVRRLAAVGGVAAVALALVGTTAVKSHADSRATSLDMPLYTMRRATSDAVRRAKMPTWRPRAWRAHGAAAATVWDPPADDTSREAESRRGVNDDYREIIKYLTPEQVEQVNEVFLDIQDRLAEAMVHADELQHGGFPMPLYVVEDGMTEAEANSAIRTEANRIVLERWRQADEMRDEVARALDAELTARLDEIAEDRGYHNAISVRYLEPLDWWLLRTED
jgi:hypothetical protein